jgi:Spy/CpxP family protein refolding chaperone
MNNQKKTLALLFILVLAACGRSWADPAPDAAKAKPTEVPAVKLTRREIMEKLQLTADQKKQLQHARASYRKQIAELDGQIKVKKVELENELDKSEPNQEKIAALTEEIGALYGKKLSVRVNASLDLEKNILTPQQSDLLKSLQPKDASSSDEIL